MTSHNGTEIRVLAASGVYGSGFRQTSLEEAMRRQPHFIGCDCAIFAGLPVRAGIPTGIAWHAAKILECGAASVEQRTSPDCLMATCGTAITMAASSTRP